MMATFADIVGYKLEENMGEDSFNALPVLLGKDEETRECLLKDKLSSV
jgi:hypothetical protein